MAMDKSDFELNPEQWVTLRGLLDSALEREPAQRAAWIDTLSGPLAEFKPRLRELLEMAADGPRHADASSDRSSAQTRCSGFSTGQCR